MRFAQRKVIRWGALIFVAAFMALGLGILIPGPLHFSEVETTRVKDEAGQRQILVLSNPIHTDIALPLKADVAAEFAFVADSGLDLAYPGVYWVVFGWGGRSFYVETPTWADLKLAPVLRSFGWDASVMHVSRAGDINTEAEEVFAVSISETEFSDLVAAIKSSFQRDSTGQPIAVEGAEYGPHDLFFEAEGGFNALLGCNTWTSRMLRSAGIGTGIWTPLPQSLNASIVLHNRD